MYEIRPWLFIGNYRETRSAHLLAARKIGAMLQLAERVEQPEIDVRALVFEDGEPIPNGFLAKGMAFVRDQHATGKKILIACGAGISRSTTFTIAALHEIEGLDLVTAYRDILEKHPQALPHPALWDSLCSHYARGIPFIEMWNQIKQE